MIIVVYIFIFNYLPIYGVQIAFREFRGNLGTWGSPWVGLAHFKRFIEFPLFWQVVRNTISINLYFLIIGFPMPVILALALNEVRNSFFKKFVQMVTYAPHFISTVVVCGMLVLFLNKDMGLLNIIRGGLGLERIGFMTEPQYFRSIHVLSSVWQHTGWSAIIYLSVLSGVSPELVEAARMDGANRFQVIRHVNIPHIAPTMIILFIMRCGTLFNLGFDKVFLLQNPLNLNTSEVISTYVYRIGLLGAQFSYSTAIGLFDTICNLLLLIIINKISAKVSEASLW